jgi:hypothetical protein
MDDADVDSVDACSRTFASLVSISSIQRRRLPQISSYTSLPLSSARPRTCRPGAQPLPTRQAVCREVEWTRKSAPIIRSANRMARAIHAAEALLLLFDGAGPSDQYLDFCKVILLQSCI